MTAQLWAVIVAGLLASAVEFVEAFIIVLVVGGFETGATLIWLFQRPDYVSQLRDYQHQAV